MDTIKIFFPLIIPYAKLDLKYRMEKRKQRRQLKIVVSCRETRFRQRITVDQINKKMQKKQPCMTLMKIAKNLKNKGSFQFDFLEFLLFSILAILDSRILSIVYCVIDPP